MNIINSIGNYDALTLFVVCAIAIILARTRFNVIAVILAAEFLIMIGFDSLIAGQVYNYSQAAYIYTIKLLIQTIFTLTWLYFGAWPLFYVSVAIMGIFSYSIGASLYAITPVYYIELMQIASVSQIIALLLGVFCVLRIRANSARSFVNHSAGVGHKK